MNTEIKINKSMVSRAIISKIQEERDPKNIYAKHVKGFKSPEKLKLKGNDEDYTPDIEVEYEDETHLYEIELEQSHHTDKWRLFTLYAKNKRGNLFLVIPDYLKPFIKKQIAENNINAGILFFET